ncbi:MAG: hypothetical protein IPK26_28780 [Planctomycetes bacterium]|nr:hypothetical protein [Planctomycetota bacterium]
MPFGSRSRSAQTPSESSQQSKSNRDPNGIGGQINGLDPAANYLVYHGWRKVGSVAKRGMPHHSQLFVQTEGGDWVLSFGLFGNDDGEIVIESEWDDNAANPYVWSKSYKPNPVTVTGAALEQAYIKVTRMCGPEYKLLHNNCQKFARLMMIELGAGHDRHLFHP